MIQIINVGPLTDDPGGERTYEVRVGENLICTFVHARRDGLAECLHRAGRAVEDATAARFRAALVGDMAAGGARR